jgi:hypothetical protein
VAAVVVVSAAGIAVLRWVRHRRDSRGDDPSPSAQHANSSCSEDNPCPAQISVHLDYKETYTASEEENGHSSSQAELTVSGDFTQKLTMTYVPDGTPDFGEVSGAAGASSGSFKLAGESKSRSLPDPGVLWDDKVTTMAASLDGAYTGLADRLAADGSPIIVGRAVAEMKTADCKATGNMHEDADTCADTGAMPITMHPRGTCQNTCGDLSLPYKLLPESERPAANPAASEADKEAAKWQDYNSENWYGTTTTRLKSGGKVTGYEVTFDGQKSFEHKRTKDNPGDSSYQKHLRVTVKIAETG